ncbi:MAG: type VI secretion system membrane subunit TssM [Gammaproteobacteria bacterium]
MKRLLGIFKRRWFISLLGFFAFGVLIWVAGPYLAFADYRPLDSEFNRLLAILLVVLAWGFNNLRRLVSARNAGNQIIQGLVAAEAAVPVAEPESEEVAALRERFDEAMEVFRKSPRRKGVRNLYELPWYVIIGPPGSGKTTALVNSGLRFPLTDRLDRPGLHGVGGTRNCDWWFTNEAILLDTAGRYTTQDSHTEYDRIAWFGFLDLVKKYRRRRPINGVLVAISVAEILSQSDAERNGHVQAIKSRIQELYKHFAIRFPIYFLFTKCDLIAGFTEFFDDLGHEERAQVWGITFPYGKNESAEGAITDFAREYELLMERLNGRLVWRLNQEPDIRRRTHIFRFLQQMEAYKETLDQFLQEVFRPSRFHEAPLLRGVYFTSGTQEGTPIDRVMATLAQRFGLEQYPSLTEPGKGRSYFITGLLRDVIFPEAGLVGVNRRFETQLAWLQSASYAGAVVATSAGVLAWSASYTTNKQYVQEVAAKVDEYRQLPKLPNLEIDGVLPRLDALYELVELARTRAQKVQLYMRLGLYQGSALGEEANDAYVRELNRILLPLVARHIEQQMGQQRTDPELLFETLKTYLMLGDTEKFVPDQVRLWMRMGWKTVGGANADRQRRANRHLENLLGSTVQPLALNVPLIRQVRLYLRQQPLAEFVYGRLKRDYMIGERTQIKIIDLIGPGGQRVFVEKGGRQLSKGIPDLYTYEKFYTVFEKESRSLVSEIKEESWVLDLEGDGAGEAELGRLSELVTEIYLRDYAKTWRDVLSNIEITPFYNVEHAVEILGVLSSPTTSPIVTLLSNVEHHTALTRVPEGADRLLEKTAKKAGKITKRLQRLFSPSEAGAEELFEAKLPSARVEAEFKQLNALVQQREGLPAPATHLTTLLSELYGYFDSKRGALLNEGGPTGGQDVIRRVKQEGARQPWPVGSWLQQIADNSRSVLISDVRSELDSLWSANVVPECSKILGDRYPINKDSADEITLDDFGRFFGYEGILDSFFKTHLEPFVDKSQPTWRWRSDTNATLGLSNEALAQFQRAQRIRETFFQQGGQKVSITFGLKPVALDKSVSRFVLDIDGQEYSYRFGPVRLSNAQWPGPDGPRQVQVVFEDRSGVRHSSAEDGPWAWFRILDRSQTTAISPDRLSVTFDVDGHQAEYELRANSVVNPFLMTELQSFLCPNTLQ